MFDTERTETEFRGVKLLVIPAKNRPGSWAVFISFKQEVTPLQAVNLWVQLTDYVRALNLIPVLAHNNTIVRKNGREVPVGGYMMYVNPPEEQNHG